MKLNYNKITSHAFYVAESQISFQTIYAWHKMADFTEIIGRTHKIKLNRKPQNITVDKNILKH